jgi:hypothetical protein
MAFLAAMAAKLAGIPIIIRVLLATIAVAAISGYAWYSGHSYGKQSILEAKIESQAQTAVTVAEQTEVTTQTEIRYVDRIEYQKGKTRTIIKEVEVHVKDACLLTPDWRLLHDKAAARSPIPRPAGEVNGRSDIAGIVAGHRGD